MAWLISRNPELAVWSARHAGVKPPEYDRLESGGNDRTLPRGTVLHTDVTVLLIRNGAKVYYVHVEPQLKFSKAKVMAIPGYHGSAVRDFDCPGCTVVISPGLLAKQFKEEDQRKEQLFTIERHYLDSSSFGSLDNPGLSLDQQATMLLLQQEWDDTSEAVLTRVLNEDSPMRDLMYDAVLEMAPNIVEASMYPKFLRDERTLQHFEARGEARGKAEGEARGEAKGKAEALLEFVSGRGDELSWRAHARITECRDAETLMEWLRRAYRGETSDQIFDTVTVA
jgi:hypothetical protein